MSLPLASSHRRFTPAQQGILRAELDAAARPDEVFAGLGLRPETWRELEEDLLASLSDDVDRGDSSGARAYAQAYRARRSELFGAAPESLELDPDHVAHGPSTRWSTEPPPTDRFLSEHAALGPYAAAMVAPPVQVPSYLQERSRESSQPAPTRGSSQPAVTMCLPAVSAPPPAALPFQRQPMTVERFARLQAALHQSCDYPAVLRAFGLDDAAFLEAARAIGRAMSNDLQLRQTYDRVFERALHHGR